MITKTNDHIEVEGHIGTWYVIDDGWYVLPSDAKRGQENIYEHCFLLEHETFGDEAACLIVNEDGKLILDEVYNGFEDLEDAGWSLAQRRQCPVCSKEFPRDDMTFTRDCHGITFRLVCFDCYEKVMARGYDGEHYTEADEQIEEDY